MYSLYLQNRTLILKQIFNTKIIWTFRLIYNFKEDSLKKTYLYLIQGHALCYFILPIDVHNWPILFSYVYKMNNDSHIIYKPNTLLRSLIINFHNNSMFVVISFHLWFQFFILICLLMIKTFLTSHTLRQIQLRLVP